MKVALLTDGFYPFVLGGMQKHSYYLARYLAEQGIDVDIYYAQQERAQNPFTAEQQQKIGLELIEFPRYHFPGHYIVESWAYSKRICEVLLPKLDSYDLIYAQGFAGWELLNRRPAAGPPVVVNLHGIEMFQKAASPRERLAQFLFYWPAYRNLRQADFVVSLGGKLTQILRERTNSTVLEIPIGVEQTWLAPAVKPIDKCRNFLFVGRYERRKGIEELNAAIVKLRPDDNFKFDFVGPISPAQQLRDPRVTYHGKVMDEGRLMSIYRESDVLVCPSYAEGMPTVILEAMASGCAVIATDVGAVSEQVIPHRNGLFVEPGNTHDLQGALTTMIEMDGETLLAMKQFSKRRVAENFLWEHVIEKTIDVFGAIVDGKASRTCAASYR